MIIEDEDLGIQEKVTQKINVPHGYYPIKFSSVGKLNTPIELHYRDITYDEAIELSITADEDFMYHMVSILNKCNFEKFDHSLLHESELEEVLMNMYFMFWGKTVDKYYFSDDQEMNEIQTSDPQKYTSIIEAKFPPIIQLGIDKIKSNPLPKEFQLPITLKKKDNPTIYKFRLPLVRDLMVAKEYIDRKYAQQVQQFLNLEKDLKINNEIAEKSLTISYIKIDADKLKAYKDYTSEKTSTFFMVRQAQLIHSVDNEVAESLEEQIELYPKISASIWEQYNKVLDTCKFGIENNIQIMSPYTNKPVIRRFLFQLMDFLPNGNVQDSDGYTVSFGE